MSERFPIGAQVRVRNDGLGNHVRKEAERVGEFTGTVVATSGPDYTGIPEVCVESATGERRVILVGDLEEGVAATEPATPRPAMKRINVTPKMVEALENTIEINGKSAMIMSHPKTQAALVLRGLADENGYLTDQGRFVARLVSVGDTPRAWSWDTLEAGTRTWLSDQKRHAEAAKPKTIKRVVNGSLVEMPAHREAAKPKAVGDVMVPPADFRVAAPTLEDIELDSDEADRQEARRESVTEYSVKIWYRSDTYEGVSHCPEELARKIFADAVKSPGVEFAELHGPDRMLVESHPRTEESTMATEPDPQTPDENLFLAGLPLLHPEPLPPAPELPQESEPTA